MATSRTRAAIRLITRGLVKVLAGVSVYHTAPLPAKGPLLVTFNHLGHLDAAILIAKLPWDMEAIALSDLYRVPVTGQMLRLYGTIPVHRDVFDRTVVERALAVLQSNGVLILAPEARMSVTGALEKARGGAAYLALKSGAPILPVALTGSENKVFYGAWKRLHRPHVTITTGQVFELPDLPTEGAQRKESIARASDEIMLRIAALLPEQYRGVYAGALAAQSSSTR